MREPLAVLTGSEQGAHQAARPDSAEASLPLTAEDHKLDPDGFRMLSANPSFLFFVLHAG
jgi:hypothetical protein